LSLAFALLPVSALAEEPTGTEARRAQLESLRAQVAGQLQLQAYDLLDELVFSWMEQPVFALDTPVVLADVSVPVGFGSGLQALIENHFAALVVKNPRTRVLLAHCPQCTSVVVHSGAKGTIISRGVDEPEALSTAGALSGSHHALFLDFEVEGAALVLRARITALEPALPIVYAKTLSTSTSSAALLRTADHLKSASEARQEYLDALRGRSLYLVPVRIGVRSYAPGNGGSIAVPPFLWLQVGAEAPLTQARAWTGSVSLGVSWMPQLHVGWMVQGRISRLLSGSVTSLTRPDLYGFVGGSVLSIHGLSALVFQDQVLDLEDVATQALGLEPQALFGAVQLGLELRLKNRIGASVFVESLPSMNNAPSLGRYVDLGLIQLHSLGVEVSFCF
jgi:hypothetical protein